MYDINNNVISKRWKERYNNLSDDVKKKLDENDGVITQLKVLNKSRKYPEIGDIFQLITNNNIEFNGIIINNHICNINGDDLIVVAIFKYTYDYKKVLNEGVLLNNIIIPFQIVGKEYWTRGYFNTIDHFDEIIKTCSYGFYSIGKGKIYDEYGKALIEMPDILGIYGVSTINGISMKLNQELIISGII